MDNNSSSTTEKDRMKAELAEMKKNIPEMENVVNENAYHVLLKLWAKLVAGTISVGLVSAIVGFAIAIYYPANLSPIFSTAKLENAIGVVLAPSVTVIGLVLGFSPVISFFFVNNIKDDQRNFKERKESFFKRLSRDKKQATKENRSLVETYYAYLDLIIHNRVSGVLKYVRSFLLISLVMLPLLIEFFVILNPLLFFLIDILLLFAIVEGIVPIITVSTYKPAIRIREYFVSTAIPNQIAIKKELETEE